MLQPIMKQQQNKELHCPGNSAALQKEGMARTVSSAAPLLSSLGPADKKHWGLGTVLWSLMSATGHCCHYPCVLDYPAHVPPSLSVHLVL